MSLAQSSQPMKASGIKWIGRIPAHWTVQPFYSFVDEVHYPNTGMKERNLLSLSYGRLVRKDMDRLEGLTPASFEGYNVVEANDIVFRLTDLQNDKTSLRSARAEERGIITSAYVTVRPRIGSRFFEYLMRSYDTTKVFYGIGGGIRQSMKFADLKRLPVVVPPDHEMEDIALYLDRATARIDALITKKTRFIELLREKRQALITHAVTKGLDASVPMKNSGVEWLGNVPAHWDVVRGIAVLVECRAKNDPLFSENYLSLMANKGIIPYDEKGDVGNKKPEDLRKCKVVEPGDFVINSMNYAIGSYGVSKYSGVCSPVYVVMKHKPNLANPRFIDLILSNPSYQNYAQSFGTGILDHRRAIGWDEIKAIPVPLPSLDEQGAIADWALRLRDRVDALIAKTRRSIELLREHRTALITAAVTGKISLRNAA
jgi:type I restriction enzyme S subunit